MSHNMDTLLTIAAELRAVGNSWEAVARKVHRKPSTCQGWPARFRDRWDPLYRDFQRKRFEETSNEAHTLLKGLMRDDNPRVRQKAVELWVKCGAAAYGLQGNLMPATPADGDAEDDLWAAARKDMTFARDRMDRRRAHLGLPPLTDDEFLKEYEEELNALLHPPPPPPAPAPASASGPVLAALAVCLAILLTGRPPALDPAAGPAFAPAPIAGPTAAPLVRTGAPGESRPALAPPGRAHTKPSTPPVYDALPGDDMPSIDDLCINTIRTLSMDAVQQANSGHPGTPMALAPVAYSIWQEVLHYNPEHPYWPNRDRFVLSVGHASMLLYSVLHLTGVKQCDPKGNPTAELAVPLDQIKKFRQLHSRTAGHPESFMTSGVETTTGPLGQGLGNSVGMAMAGRWLAAHFNKPDFKMFDYHVYALCGDGDLMEGISGEAASLAGHLKLPNLTWIYDSNHITIDGKTDLSFSEDVGQRFLGYHWNVLKVADANDRAAIAAALQVAKGTTDRPTIIIVTSHIGYGAPKKQDTSDAHGEPLGEEEIKGAKRAYGWPENEKFLVPEGVREHFAAGVGRRGAQAFEVWQKLFDRYKAEFPDLADQLVRMEAREFPAGWDKDLPTFPADPKGLASRDSGGKVINALAKNIPWLIGGAADLAKSTKTTLKVEGAGDFGPDGPGRNLHFGIREHVMASALNGMSQSKVRPFGSGFLIFSDYARPAIRLSALMGMPTIHVFTHDSIGVGEDGPTHQPIEQLMSLRMIPNMVIFRPADANEVTEAWKVIAQLQHSPACLLLSRQALPTFDRTKYAPAAGVVKGGYVLADAGGKPDVILIGTGSEVSLCVEAYEKLTAEGIRARVVSLPSWDHFEKQPQSYRESVLPPSVTARVTVEMGTTMGWEKYASWSGMMIGMHGYGASAPIKDLLKEFGFTADAVYQAAKKQVGA